MTSSQIRSLESSLNEPTREMRVHTGQTPPVVPAQTAPYVPVPQAYMPAPTQAYMPAVDGTKILPVYNPDSADPPQRTVLQPAYEPPAEAPAPSPHRTKKHQVKSFKAFDPNDLG